MKIGKYLVTSFTNLVPPMVVPENPITLLRMLNRRQAALFLVAFFAWTLDAFDFFSVTLNVIEIGKTFNKTVADITWGITVTLMLRSVGAILFGIAGDRFGRKWPFIVNIVFYATLEILTGFCTTYGQFIVCRASFGVAMGGIYGNCATTALEDAPPTTRGLLSGILQQGYALGFILAAVFNLAITNNQCYGWRALFWIAGFLPLLVALWRVFLPETEEFLRVKEARKIDKAKDGDGHEVSAVQAVINSIRPTLAHYWLTLIYLILMMSGFNFLAHGSQDLYPTFLSNQLRFSPGFVTLTTIVASCGALVGGSLIGYFSSFFGRRLSIIVVLIAGAALIPAYLLPRNKSIMVGAFFQQLCVQGAWGVVPIHLMELSPEEFRSFVVGTAYQLGNLISSASSTIEATLGQRFPLESSHDTSSDHRFDYGKVMAIFLACTYVYLLIIILLGPEKRNTKKVKKTDVELVNQNAKDDGVQSKLLTTPEDIRTAAKA
ncbi:unnamed protein product [Rotaria sp. Silwood1]|nr:unnamed protein product [Rotaria sp. Silwood1]CAF3495335.1 unnamed protein product [Rotaria sp. Silwood1]CAF3537886.1 unnamed protein product [Rotaria sp. Silwood1]CAF4848700.1 unnamed protein product [Rotaria sp. Silwood1]CAF4923290.1 unnamed protein product [Rotaria sp. Silwood1]